uniref:Peptidase M48 domain-containing protein n=1 Tax=Aegilops tauschii TaxID=37682 RepID=M8BLH5_AEGTA
MPACQVVPGTNRSHLVVLSAQKERDLGESHFAELKHIYRHRTVDPHHPDSVRLRLIADRIIHAANRCLGIYDSRDAPLLSVTRKGKKKPWARQPHTRHLHGLDTWELVLVSDGRIGATSSPGGRILVFTGLLDLLKTDGEIAFCIAHEVRFLPQGFRAEIEADRIGILLLAAAGFHPDHALAFAKKAATVVPKYSVLKQMLEITHPHPEDRLARLSEAKTMEEALELYREATARDKVTEKYFSNPTILEVELEDCRECLQLALHRTQLPIIFEMDCSEAVSMINLKAGDQSRPSGDVCSVGGDVFVDYECVYGDFVNLNMICAASVSRRCS